MSFVRVGRPQQHSKGKRPVRPKKAAGARKDWVSTVNDLSVHKLTPAELRHRHEIHKSHNQAAAQWELKEKALKRHFRHAGSPGPLDQASISIIREVFSDQLLLQDVLARSDRAMAVVKDLFGDAPSRQTGHPSVTMAPNCDSDSELPVLQRPDPPTQLSLLSQSMMDQEALNEVEDSEEDHRDKECVRRTNGHKKKVQSRSRVGQQQKYNQLNRDFIPVTPSSSERKPQHTALNATVAVQRVRSRQMQSGDGKDETSVLVSQVLNPEPPLSHSERMDILTNRTRKCHSQSLELESLSAASISGDQSSLALLQNMLGQVEADLDSMSPYTAVASAQSPKQHKTQSLTGFSVALVSTIGRLAQILKQKEDEALKEAKERGRLEEELREQRGLIDALTAEMMTQREEAADLQAGLRQQFEELEQKLDSVVLVIGGLGLLGEYSGTVPPSDVNTAVCQSAPFAERDPKQTQVSAVAHFPPHQSNKHQQTPVNYPAEQHQQLPPVALPPLQDTHTHGSALSLNSQPPTARPSSSPSLSSDARLSQLTPQAMLAEIAQLSRQNELIRVQLDQARALGSEVRGSICSSSSEKRSSSSSSGRITPQSAGERKTSGSSSSGRITPQSAGERKTSGSSSSGRITPQSTREIRTSVSSITGRQVQHSHGPAEETPSQQTSPNSISVSSVEQRLLELNRQSAAARGRLLELIEQQKQSVSVKMSPSVSPIPPSAFSPNPAAGDGDAGESSLLPDPERQSHSAERRLAGSIESSHSFGDDKTQMDRQRQREGWFALSAHMK